jgi:hypothetical protein
LFFTAAASDLLIIAMYLLRYVTSMQGRAIMNRLIERRANPDRRKVERQWWNERRGHVPVIDRRNYPPVTENHCPVIREFGRG